MSQKKSAGVSKKSSVNGVKVGVGVATVAAAMAGAAGAYWLYGSKDAAKNRKSVKSFMLKARADALEAVEKVTNTVGSIDKQAYLNIVDGVVKRYSTMAGVTAAEVEQMTKDLKTAWAHMQSVAKNMKTPNKAAIKKTIQKEVKTAVKKAAGKKAK